MATPAISTANLTRITAAEAADSAGWLDIGGGQGSAQNTDQFVQGTESRGRRVDNAVRGFWFDNGSGIDLTGHHLFMWVLCTTPGSLATQANGGIRVRVGSSTANYDEWYAEGSDTYGGGWKRLVIDPSKPATATGGSGLSPTSAQYFGAAFDVGDVGGNAANAFIDAIDYGKGLIVTGGTSGDRLTWRDIVDENATNANAYGILQERSGVIFCLGEIQLGDDAGSPTESMFFDDTDQTLVWEPRSYHDGSSQFSAAADTLNKLIITASGDGVVDFRNGVKVGSGDDAVGSNGCIYQAAPGGLTALQLDFSDAEVASVEFYGCTFRRISQGLSLSADPVNGPNHAFIGNTVDQSGQADVGRAVVRSGVFSGATGRSALIWNANIDIKNCGFNANLSAGSPTLDDVHAGIEHAAAGTFSYDNLSFSGNDPDILNASAGDVTINAVNGSDPFSFADDGGSPAATVINNTITFTLTGLQSGSEVRIYDLGGNELAGTESGGASFTYQYNFAGDTDIYVVVHHLDFVWLRLDGLTLSNADQSVPVQQRSDRNYENA